MNEEKGSREEPVHCFASGKILWKHKMIHYAAGKTGNDNRKLPKVNVI